MGGGGLSLPVCCPVVRCAAAAAEVPRVAVCAVDSVIVVSFVFLLLLLLLREDDLSVPDCCPVVCCAVVEVIAVAVCAADSPAVRGGSLCCWEGSLYCCSCCGYCHCCFFRCFHWSCPCCWCRGCRGGDSRQLPPDRFN